MTEEEHDDLEMKFKAFEEYKDQSEVTSWELGFIEDQIKRFEEYGPRARYSDKQMAIINRVYDEKIAPLI